MLVHQRVKPMMSKRENRTASASANERRLWPVGPVGPVGLHHSWQVHLKHFRPTREMRGGIQVYQNMYQNMA